MYCTPLSQNCRSETKNRHRAPPDEMAIHRAIRPWYCQGSALGREPSLRSKWHPCGKSPKSNDWREGTIGWLEPGFSSWIEYPRLHCLHCLHYLHYLHSLLDKSSAYWESCNTMEQNQRTTYTSQHVLILGRWEMLNDRIEHQLRSEIANVIQHDLTTVDLAMTHEPFEYSVLSALKWE